MSGHLTLGLADVLSDLTEIGFNAEWGTYRASDIGAPHRRERVFIIAYPDSQGLQGHNGGSGEAPARGHGHPEQGNRTPATNTINNGLQHTSKRVDTRQGSDATTGYSGPATDTNYADGEPQNPRVRGLTAGHVDWGKYEPAIRRWERLTRPAPAPTYQRSGRDRLNPDFVEWMMGLPEGHVTGHGLSTAKQLKMLGNGVVPQQAAAAISQLMERTA